MVIQVPLAPKGVKGFLFLSGVDEYMQPLILYRDYDMSAEELVAASKNFPCTNSRMEVVPGSLVIGRYSVLPFYKELENDLTFIEGVKLINPYLQHCYVADLQNWYQDLKGLTPETWFRIEDVPRDSGPFVLKGKTNSKKFDWGTHMYAADIEAAHAVHWRLCQDGLIGSQNIYIRRYVPLVQYTTAMNGLPITKEFRVFILDGQVLCGAYYWTGFDEEFPTPSFEEVPKPFLDEVLRRVGDKIRFYVVDVAQTQAGEWIVIELNDAQMSGLSDNNPETLYSRLSEKLR